METLQPKDINASVTLSGWVNRRRDHGGLIFMDLRDRFGLTQLVFDPIKAPEAHRQAEKLRSEWVISIKGKVIPAREGMANPNLATGEIEIFVTEMEILSKAKTPPFSICDEQIDVNEELRLKYRYLDIRRGDIAKKLVTRHQTMLATRQLSRSAMALWRLPLQFLASRLRKEPVIILFLRAFIQALSMHCRNPLKFSNNY